VARQDFIKGLESHGYQVQDLGDNKLCFEYSIPFGTHAGQAIRLGFLVADDWPLNPPSGPHVSPLLLPINPGGAHPNGGINQSPFGPDWEYWSRPFPQPPGWANTDRSVKTYMKHIMNLFRTS
jgi:hypothetical protein